MLLECRLFNPSIEVYRVAYFSMQHEKIVVYWALKWSDFVLSIKMETRDATEEVHLVKPRYTWVGKQGIEKNTKTKKNVIYPLSILLIFKQC